MSKNSVTVRAFWEGLPTAGRWLLANVAFTHIGRGMTLPFTVIYLHEVRHVSLDLAGALMAYIAVVALATTAPGGLLIDRVGARKVLILTAVTTAVGAATLGLSSTVPMFFAAFTVIGAGFGVVWPAASSLIAAVVEGPIREQFFGVNFALLNLGIGVGGVIGGLVANVADPRTFTLIYLIDAAFNLVPLALYLGPLRHVHGRPPTPEEHEAHHASDYLSILRQPVVLAMTAAAFVSSVIGYGQMETGFPGFVREASQVSTRIVGFAFAANTAAIVLLQFAVMKLLAGRRRTRGLVMMAVIWGWSWVLLGVTALVPGSWAASAGVVGFMIIFGLGETLLQPTMPAIINDIAPAHLRGRYNSLNSAAFSLGGLVAPVTSGWLLHKGWATGLVVLVIGGCALFVLLILMVERRLPASANGLAGADHHSGAEAGVA